LNQIFAEGKAIIKKTALDSTHQDISQEAGLPLARYRILDLTGNEGAYCGRLMADFGADVIKIERPGGDFSRNIGPFYKDLPHPERSIPWYFLNANKRGVTLNIETADGRQILETLLKRAHFLIESSPAGYLETVGLGYSTLQAINPGLIMVSITPFGQNGPWQDWKSCDLTHMALSGFANILGEPDRAPMRLSVDQACLQAGAQAAAGAMIAHYYRQKTGKGQHIDLSIQEAVNNVTTGSAYRSEIGEGGMGGQRSGRRFNRGHVKALDIWECRDGYVAWRIWTGQLGSKTKAVVDWMNSEGLGLELKEVDWAIIDYGTITQEQLDTWESHFAKFFLRHTKEQLYEKAIEWGASLFPVNTPKDLAGNKQLGERGFWAKIEHPEVEGTFNCPSAAVKSSAYYCGIRYRSPMVGEHNSEIYIGELGFSKEDIIILKQAGII